MKIMFAKGDEAKLTRNEMVGLVNLLAKMSDSLKWYQEWIEIEDSKEIYRTIYKVASVGLLVLMFMLFFCDRSNQVQEDSKKDSEDKAKEEVKTKSSDSPKKRKID